MLKKKALTGNKTKQNSKSKARSSLQKCSSFGNYIANRASARKRTETESKQEHQVSPMNDNKELSNITQITAVTKQMIGNTSKDMAP